MPSGRDIYRKLMDINITLSSVDDMGPLLFFLDSISPTNEALAKLDKEIRLFTVRLNGLVAAAKSI